MSPDQSVPHSLHRRKRGAVAWRSLAWSIAGDQWLRAIALLALTVVLVACQQDGSGGAGGAGGGGDGY
jgi:hypothetical protein